MTRTLKVVLLTLGDAERLSGGYLYHLRIRELAALNNASMEIVPIRDVAFPLRLHAARNVLRAALTLRPDVIVVDSIVVAALAPALHVTPAMPVVAAVHQPPGGMDGYRVATHAQRLLDVMAYRRCSAFIAASHALADALVESGLRRESITVVEPGADGPATATAAPGLSNRLRDGRHAAIVCVGNWIPRKGIVPLLEAVALLPNTTATLHLVGEPSDRGYSRTVRRRLATPQLRERVVAHGRLAADELGKLLAAADVFCLPSFVEPYGTVYGEAMRAALPVVGWRAGNLPELVTDGVEGRVIPPGDVAGLARALLELAEDPALRTRMGAAARERSVRLPTWQDTAARFYDVLREAAASRRPLHSGRVGSPS